MTGIFQISPLCSPSCRLCSDSAGAVPSRYHELPCSDRSGNGTMLWLHWWRESRRHCRQRGTNAIMNLNYRVRRHFETNTWMISNNCYRILRQMYLPMLWDSSISDCMSRHMYIQYKLTIEQEWLRIRVSIWQCWGGSDSPSTQGLKANNIPAKTVAQNAIKEDRYLVDPCTFSTYVSQKFDSKKIP